MNRTQHLDNSTLLNWIVSPSINYQLWTKSCLQNKPIYPVDPVNPVKNLFAKRTQFPAFSPQKQGLPKKRTQIKPVSWIPGFLDSWVPGFLVIYAKRTQFSVFQSKIEPRKFIPKGSKITKRTQIKPVSWVPGFLDSWVLGFSGSWIPGFLCRFTKQSQFLYLICVICEICGFDHLDIRGLIP
jgi:hypothetical protein